MGTACATSIHLGEYLDRQEAEDKADDYFEKVRCDLAAERLKSYEETDGRELDSDLGEIWGSDCESFASLEGAMKMAAIAANLPAGEDKEQAIAAAGKFFVQAVEQMAYDLSESAAERFIKAEERERRDYF
jgi:hypothetical protein